MGWSVWTKLWIGPQESGAAEPNGIGTGAQHLFARALADRFSQTVALAIVRRVPGDDASVEDELCGAETSSLLDEREPSGGRWQGESACSRLAAHLQSLAGDEVGP
jgi:hypothetical protein